MYYKVLYIRYEQLDLGSTCINIVSRVSPVILYVRINHWRNRAKSSIRIPTYYEYLYQSKPDIQPQFRPMILILFVSCSK